MSENQLQSIFQIIANDAMMGFIVFNANTKECVYVNKLAYRLMELELDAEPSSLKMEAMYPPPPDSDVVSGFRVLSEDMTKSEGLYQGVMMQKSNGHQFIANLGVKKTEINGEDHLLLMVQDITIQMKLQREVTAKQMEIKAAYESLVQQNQQLKSLDKAKDKFIALTTHELRTPAAAMFATVDVLVNKMYDTDEEREEFIQMIHEQGQALLDLINDVLDFSKIQAGRMDYFIDQQKIFPVLEEEVENQQNFAESEKIKVTLEKPDIEPDVWFDDLRLRQVVRNILSNAIKYNRKDGEVKIWMEHSPEFNLVRVYIEDTGKGISEEEQEKVFNEFETLGKVNAHHKGTGLGMPISRKMMQEMGGALLLKSEVDVGSTFWIEIPTEKVLEDEEVYRTRPTGDDLATII